MARPNTFLIWAEGGQRYGLPLEKVRKAERMAAMTALSSPVPGVLGIINIAGQIVPVISLQQRFQPGTLHAARFYDQLVLGGAADRPMAAFIAESIEGVAEIDDDFLVRRGDMVPVSAPLAALIKSPGGLVLVPELEELMEGPLPAAEGPL